MKKYIALVLFAIVTVAAFAQSNYNYEDVVCMNNGRIIPGVINEQFPNKSIQIEAVDRNAFVYQMDEIANELKKNNSLSSKKETAADCDVIYFRDGSEIEVKVTEVSDYEIKYKWCNNLDGPTYTKRTHDVFKIKYANGEDQIFNTFTNANDDDPGASGKSYNRTGLQSGYKGIVELGPGFAWFDGFKLNIINGYQINPYFSLGFGTGLRYYNNYKYGQWDAVLIPLFADFRANFINKKVSPYLSLGVGYSYDATDDFSQTGAGILLNTIIGVSFKVSEKSALNGYDRGYDTIADPGLCIYGGISF